LIFISKNRTALLLVFFCILWLNILVVSALGILARGRGFDSRVAPLFHWVATSGKLFTHIASTVSQLQETGVQKESFLRLSAYEITLSFQLSLRAHYNITYLYFYFFLYNHFQTLKVCYFVFAKTKQTWKNSVNASWANLRKQKRRENRTITPTDTPRATPIPVTIRIPAQINRCQCNIA